jgi:ABC-type sugar transport system substrate-binding protein
MKAYPDLAGIFGISSVAFPGAAEAVRQAGHGAAAGGARRVLVTGLATPNAMRGYIVDGTVKSVVLWDTRDLGYLTVRAARALMDGTLAPGATSFAAGRLGAKVVAGDQVLLDNLLVFTRDNLARFDF